MRSRNTEAGSSRRDAISGRRRPERAPDRGAVRGLRGWGCAPAEHVRRHRSAHGYERFRRRCGCLPPPREARSPGRDSLHRLFVADRRPHHNGSPTKGFARVVGGDLRLEYDTLHELWPARWWDSLRSWSPTPSWRCREPCRQLASQIHASVFSGSTPHAGADDLCQRRRAYHRTGSSRSP